MAGPNAADSLELSPQGRRHFMQYLGGGTPQGYRMWVQDHLVKPLQATLEGIIPESLWKHYQHLLELEARLGQSPDTPMQVSPADCAVLRRAALHHRYQLALQQERLHALNIDAAHASAIDQRTEEVDSHLAEPALTAINPCPRPTLTDYVTLKTARSIVAALGAGVLPTRRYDDKFGILWPPSSVSELLEACRIESWLLRTTMGVAFLDIDDFKKVNALLTETVVDRKILPRLMLLLEAHTSQRGYAVRQGGDEYLLVFPNATSDDVERTLESIRVAILAAFQSKPTITVSIGHVNFDSDCTLTNNQILLEANRAKDEAKASGKNRVHFRRVTA